MERWFGKLAIVTGASSGIGAATAEALVKHGMTVVGFSRRAERVALLAETLAGEKGSLHSYKVDVTDATALLEAMRKASSQHGPLHVLVNNAGVARPTTIANASLEDLRAVIETNVLAVAAASGAAIRDMVENGVDGHVVNVNSILGHYVAVLPLHNVYPASKHAITAMTETLRQEMFAAGKRIRVTSVSPGYVKTEISEGFLEDEVLKEIEKAAPYLEPSDVADAIVYALSAPQHVQVTELTIRPTGESV